MFGGYDLTKFPPDQQISWNQVIYGQAQWSLVLLSAKFSGISLQNQQGEAVIDTSKPYLIMPVQAFKVFMHEFMRNRTCSLD